MSSQPTYKYDAFISYNPEDYAWVEQKLIPRLKQAGISFIHRETFEIGEFVADEINRATIESCKTLMIITPSYLTSNWERFQRVLQITHGVETDTWRAIPVIVRETQLPPPLRSLVPLDLTTNSEQAWERLIKVFAPCRRTEPPPPPPPQRVIVTAVMGVKGGVGKTTFISCTAQMLCEAGRDVVVIDLDLTSGGSTNSVKLFPNRIFTPIKTVYDHIAPHSPGFSTYKGISNESLWDITPSYLQKPGLGKIWLVPASRPSDVGGFEVVANLPEPRQEKLLTLIMEVTDRVKRVCPEVGWILLDCGADSLNPIYSAAFVCADYGYIITIPDAAYFDEFAKIRAQHNRRFPNENFDHVYNIVNRVTSDEDKIRSKGVRPIAFVPRDNLLEQDSFRAAVDYDLGYDEVSREIYKAFDTSLSPTDKLLLPDEINIRIRPWWSQFVERNLATRTLHSRAFRLRWILLWSAAFLCSIAAILTVGMGIARNAFPEFQTWAANNAWVQPLLLFIALGDIPAIFFLRRTEQKRRLLQRIAKLNPSMRDEQRTLLNELITQADHSSLRWLKQLLAQSQAEQKISQAYQITNPPK